MRFVPRPEAEYEVKATPEASAALLRIAEAGVEQAIATAPGTGSYRESMRAAVSEMPSGFAGILYNTDYKAVWIERGTLERFTAEGISRGRMPAYHVLYNAVRAIGLYTFEVS